MFSQILSLQGALGGGVAVVDPPVVEVLKAFPSAMGAGAYSEGGRGGEVVHVTNLNDSGVGSLRWALQDASNKGLSRTIVFDVSGVIQLLSDIRCSNNVGDEGGYANGLTIAGQSAPDGNITITGGKIFLIGIDDVVIRYSKFRSTTQTSGCLQAQDGNNVIFDHLTASHVESGEIAFSVTSNRTVEEGLTTDKTVQSCLLHNSGLGIILGDSTPPNDTHNEAFTIINNAFVDVGWRAPAKIGGAVRADIINNTVHNHFGRLIRIDDWSYTLNNVGNYYSRGYNNVDQYLNVAYYGTNNGLIYENANYYDPAFEYLPWSEFLNFGAALPPTSFSDTVFAYNNAETISVKSNADLKTEVLPFIGAYKHINDSGVVVEERDAFDTDAINRAINEVNNGAATSYDLLLANIPTKNNSRPVGFYGTNQHIPQAYLTANGLSDTLNVHNETNNVGYTQLEIYLNQVDAGYVPTPPVAVTGVTIDIASDVEVNSTIQLTTTFAPTNATNKTGIWTIDSETFATINSTTGLVTGISAGISLITFTADDTTNGTFSDTINITTTALPSATGGIILNGTFEDATNLTLIGSGLSVANGALTYLDSGTANVDFALTGNLIAGNSYTFEFEVTSGTARLRPYFLDGVTEETLTTGYANFSVGVHTITDIPSVNMDGFRLYFSLSSIDCTVDNVSLIIT